MKSLIVLMSTVGIWLINGCTNSVRDIDLQNKQFEATYSVDSTQGLDSTQLENFSNAKMLYSFSEGGKGTQLIQTGMLSRNTPFTWKVQKDSLSIDDRKYAIEKQVYGYKLKSNLEMLILSKQP